MAAAKDAPVWLDVTDEEGDSPLRVGLHFVEIAGRKECVGVEIWSARPDERPLQATDVRIPLRELVRDALDPTWRDTQRAAIAKQDARMRARQPDKRLKYTLADIKKIARTYADALQSHTPATKAVAKKFDITETAAAKLVARIRVDHPELLPPAKKK